MLVKCYGSTAVSKTASPGSTPGTFASFYQGVAQLVECLVWDQEVGSSSLSTLTIYESNIDMDRNEVIKQIALRMIVFFLICIATGFILSDLNIHSQLAEGNSQNVQDFRRD